MMERQHLNAQLKQMLKQGHSCEELRRNFVAPAATIEQAITEYKRAQRRASVQSHQATYAMGL